MQKVGKLGEWARFQGKLLCCYYFSSLLNGGQLLEGRICPQQKNFPLREDPFLKGPFHGGEPNRDKLFPFLKMTDIHGGVPIHLKIHKQL